MTQKSEAKGDEKPRRTLRRSEEYKARLSAASTLLGDKMEEKRYVWDTKSPAPKN